MNVRLSDCKIGEEVEISKIEDGNIASKLIEMGLTEKLITQIVLIAPLGDPIAIDINGFILSIRKAEANQVLVKKINP
ncbi:MAG: ferrous iron transport protein A [Flavobacteriales bacterium]|jgi:ferrous iron transport protein A|nr:ferrous iron transport protein A [Flavobacteriales bacterium]MBT5932265.1 ferrous iron transport protein A [Flavobacteriales bacterium]MDC3308616.1 ferrous iron transport protein A [Crocinitomicaceae bacterium]